MDADTFLSQMKVMMWRQQINELIQPLGHHRIFAIECIVNDFQNGRIVEVLSLLVLLTRHP
ncbi:MAG: hypothetical protein CMI08_05825 [Oceanospirillaceae bacterium]|nr:hypothetical protein [Oceanospirillaceae bacterium]